MTSQLNDPFVRLAKNFAIAAHSAIDQKRKYTFESYIVHPATVAAILDKYVQLPNVDEQRVMLAAAWLHDVVEDTKITLQDLRTIGFPLYIIEAVDLLTHRKNEPNLSYWGKIKPNPDALAVKLADINDNVNDTPSEYAKQKYGRALSFFNAH